MISLWYSIFFVLIFFLPICLVLYLCSPYFFSFKYDFFPLSSSSLSSSSLSLSSLSPSLSPSCPSCFFYSTSLILLLLLFLLLFFSFYFFYAGGWSNLMSMMSILGIVCSAAILCFSETMLAEFSFLEKLIIFLTSQQILLFLKISIEYVLPSDSDWVTELSNRNIFIG